MSASRILIAEDEALVAADLARCLAEMGYAIAGIVDTGEAAVAQTLALKPDLVLMDIRLKGQLDGIEAAGQIRTAYRPPPPVVFLTAYADEETLARAGYSDPFAYVVKPFDIRALRAAVQTAFYRHNAEVRLRKLERRLATTLRSLGNAVIATDKDGLVNYINPMGEALTGWTLFEAMGQPLAHVFRVVRARDRQPIPDPAQRAVEEGRMNDLNHDTLLLRRDGRETPIEENTSPIRDDEGRITGAVLIIREATARREPEGHSAPQASTPPSL
jgi:PAS domain S-box-containing protein